MSKDTYFFSHDYGARNDPKLLKVLMKLGQAGKGTYWDLIEMLYEQGGKLQLSEIESYAFALHSDSTCITSLINDFELFKNDGSLFWSESVDRRLQVRAEKSQKAANSANKRWDKAGNYANALQTNSDSNAIKDIKGKNSKGKNNKGKVFTPPDIIEVKAYFIENGFSETAAIRAFKHYDTGNWHDTNGNQVINWKQKLRTNWFTPENQAPVHKERGFVS